FALQRAVVASRQGRVPIAQILADLGGRDARAGVADPATGSLHDAADRKAVGDAGMAMRRLRRRSTDAVEHEVGATVAGGLSTSGLRPVAGGPYRRSAVVAAARTDDDGIAQRPQRHPARVSVGGITGVLRAVRGRATVQRRWSDPHRFGGCSRPGVAARRWGGCGHGALCGTWWRVRRAEHFPRLLPLARQAG